MSASGFTPIQLYYSTTNTNVPVAGNLLPGELGFNIHSSDFSLYAENSAGTVTRLMNNPAGLKYPTADGTSGYAITTNGAGVLSFSLVGDVTLNGVQTLTNKTLVAPVLGTPTSGALTNCTADGTNAVGFRTVPQNSQSTAYTAVLADSGKHLLHPSADTTARTFTIPANASVAYPIGTALTFVNQASAGVMTIAITSDTMRWAGLGTTGSRTLAANGIATALKITSTEWLISGTGLA